MPVVSSMSPKTFPQNNRTWQILTKARENSYAVGAYNCYNTDGIQAVLRAAERQRSPAIIQLFPWSLHFHGEHFIRYVVAAAHAASVPVAVHLDHCVEPSDVETALMLPFDSIMIDASTSDTTANEAFVSAVTARASRLGITLEAELGRIEGGEDGLATVDMDAVLTDPGYAAEFVRHTGVQFLAPSFGNVHGGYPTDGAEACWQLDRLGRIAQAVGTATPLVLHGTHPVSDRLFREAVSRGVVKVNLNRTVRDEYSAFVTDHAGKMELTRLTEQAVEVYAKSIERMMRVLGSVGKAE